MRWVFNHPEEARLLGEHARLSTVRFFSPQQRGRRLLDRLNQIRSEHSEKKNAVNELRYRLTSNS